MSIPFERLILIFEKREGFWSKSQGFLFLFLRVAFWKRPKDINELMIEFIGLMRLRYFFLAVGLIFSKFSKSQANFFKKLTYF